MNTLKVIFIISTVGLLALGQILFKISAPTINFSYSGIGEALTNIKLLFALSIYCIATILWLWVLKVTPLQQAYPFVALAFIIVPLLAHFIINEPLNWNHLVGAILIGAGVCISVL